MSGTLGLGSPWTRAAIPPDTKRAIETFIPDAWRINVTAYEGGNARFNVAAYGPNDYPYEPSIRVVAPRDRVADVALEVALRLNAMRCTTCGKRLDSLGDCDSCTFDEGERVREATDA